MSPFLSLTLLPVLSLTHLFCPFPPCLCETPAHDVSRPLPAIAEHVLLRGASAFPEGRNLPARVAVPRLAFQSE